MIGLRLLLVLLFATMNTAFWAAILHFLGLLELLYPPLRIILLSGVFVFSLMLVFSFGIGQSDEDSPGPNGENGPSEPA